MNFIIFLLLLLNGFLLTVFFFRNRTFLETVAYSILFGITAVPFCVTNLAFFANIYITKYVLLIVSFLLFLILINLIKKKNFVSTKITKNEIICLGITVLLALFFFLYYTNSEFILSLASYFIKGEAECFYMQTFKLLSSLNPGVTRERIYEAYNILCTPGNIISTGSMVSLFKSNGFKILYILFQCLGFMFMFMFIERLTKKTSIAIFTALFSVLNPYSLYIEVLDRNTMVFVFGIVLFYSLFFYNKKIFLHGLLFGIVSGMGLRFLPVLFIVPILFYYLTEKKRPMEYLIFAGAALVTFGFNLPHLSFHGLHSLGETESALSLIWIFFSKWLRTPFLPYPNILYYLFLLFTSLGYIASSLIFFGAFKTYSVNKRHFAVLGMVFFLPLLALSFQRNWIEQDKIRILLTGIFPLFIFFGKGLSVFLTDTRKYLKNGATVLMICFSLFFLKTGLSRINFKEDAGFYNRKMLYQKETPVYNKCIKKNISDISILPDYLRLSQKSNIKRKINEEKIILSNLFGDKKYNPDIYGNFYREWEKEFIVKHTANQNSSEEFVTIKIDFDKLTEINPAEAVSLDEEPSPIINFEKPGEIYDLYYEELSVRWQIEKLSVAIMPQKAEVVALKELSIDLNAFINTGGNEDGFATVNTIVYAFKKEKGALPLDSMMLGFPLFADGSTIKLRIPKDLKIIIKNWFVNGENAIPFKTDSWEIYISKKGELRIRFFYNEPESYL